MKDKNKIIDIKINTDNELIKGILYILSRFVIGTIMAVVLAFFCYMMLIIGDWLNGINPWLAIVYIGGIVITMLLMLLDSLFSL